ncbi:MAG: phage tail sheath C-terminal domain-containing protein [Bacteroidia bacterium]
MSEYKIPGVYIEEESVFPPSVSATATAIPAFLGYTAVAVDAPQRIQSLMEFESIFGLPPARSGPTVTLGGANMDVPTLNWDEALPYHQYYCVEHYFRNGGGPCWVISTGVAGSTLPTTSDEFLAALDKLRKLDEPTLIVLSDALNTLKVDDSDYTKRHQMYLDVLNAAMGQCDSLKDRFVIADMPEAGNIDVAEAATAFRTAVTEEPSYAAAYYPYLETSLSRRPVFVYKTQIWADTNAGKNYSSWVSTRNSLPVLSYTGSSTPGVELDVNDNNDTEAAFEVSTSGIRKVLTLKLKNGERYSGAQIKTAFDKLSNAEGYTMRENVLTNPSPAKDHEASAFLRPTLAQTTQEASVSDLKQSHPALYADIAARISSDRSHALVLPPASAMAGIYSSVDRDRGVWKSPANVALSATTGPATLLSRDEQEGLDVDATSGKSINCIVKFTGKGTLPWGARTLDASSLDWRYIAVRRLFIMAEESIKKAAQFAVFEPNDKGTWTKVKGMINNFLYSLWQKGALMGGKPEEAYFVQVGLGETMSFQDVLEGRMIIQVGMAAVRPAEFIILKFSQTQQTA